MRPRRISVIRSRTLDFARAMLAEEARSGTSIVVMRDESWLAVDVHVVTQPAREPARGEQLELRLRLPRRGLLPERWTLSVSAPVRSRIAVVTSSARRRRSPGRCAVAVRQPARAGAYLTDEPTVCGMDLDAVEARRAATRADRSPSARSSR
jgi:hypothetical protein